MLRRERKPVADHVRKGWDAYREHFNNPAFFGIRVKVARKPALLPHIGSVTASAPQDMEVRWCFRRCYVLLLPQCLF